MDQAFEDQIGRNVEVYMDDIIVKSKAEQNFIQDLAKVFSQLRKYNVQLNPNKCALGV